MGGKPTDGTAAWRTQQPVRTAVRMGCSGLSVGTCAKGVKRSLAERWTNGSYTQCTYTALVVSDPATLSAKSIVADR